MIKYNLYLISMALIQTVLPNHIVLHATLLFIDFYKVFDSIKKEKLDRYYWHMISPKKLLPLWWCFKKNTKAMLPSPDGNRNNFRLCRCNLWRDIGITCSLPWPTDDPAERSFTFLQSCGHRIRQPLTFPSLASHVVSLGQLMTLSRGVLLFCRAVVTVFYCH